LTAYFRNLSEAGHEEVVSLSTVQLRDGSILYMVGVAPESEYDVYERAFDRARQTLQISDQRTR
jgi:hypothetical protein